MNMRMTLEYYDSLLSIVDTMIMGQDSFDEGENESTSESIPARPQ